jgi:DNA-binding transcriptional ArsR family regulator
MNLAPHTQLDLTLTALADPTRRAILQRLLHGEARVTELAKPFAISLNSVSKHIRVLERAGLLRRRRAGREHILSFDPSRSTRPAPGSRHSAPPGACASMPSMPCSRPRTAPPWPRPPKGDEPDD